VHPVAIEREHRFILRNALFEPLLRAQHLAFGVMCKRAAGECRQGSIGERFRMCEVGRGEGSHLIEHARCQLRCQIALRPLRTWIERQRTLVERNLLRIILTRRHPSQIKSPCAHNIIERIRPNGRSGGLRTDEFEVKRDRYSARDLVLQRKQIARVAVQAVGPQMRVGLGIDQLGAHTDPVARPLDAPFQHIAHSQLAPDLPCISRSVPISERGIARDHGHLREPRQVGRQVLGDSVGKILLLAVVAQIDEGQDHDRQARRNGRGGIHSPLLHRSLAGPAAHTNLAGELVAATGDRPDQIGVRQGYAQRPYLGAQIAFFDDPARPDAADQLVLADDRPVGLDQRHEHIEGAPAELYRPAVGENFAAMRQDPETAELDARRRFGHGIHGSI
jgi:hypothetical protein